jgi:hypothetical protein
MSFLDFQIRTDLLARALQARNVLTPTLVEGEYLLSDGATVAVNSIDVLDAASIEEAPTSTIMVIDENTPAEDVVPCKMWRLVQPIAISLRNLVDGNPYSEEIVQVPIALSAGLSDSGRPIIREGVLTAQVNLEVFEELDPQLANDLAEALVAFGGDAPIPIAPLEGLTGEALTFANVGLAVSNDNQVAAVRAEFTLHGLGRAALWADFCQGAFPNRLSGQDWAVFYPKVLLEKMLERGIPEPSDAIPDFNVILDSGPTQSWHGSPPTVTSEFTLTIQNFCFTGVPPFLFPVDADADITIVAAFTASGSNLVVDLILDVTLDPMAQIHCGIVMGTFWPVVGLMMHPQLENYSDFGSLYTFGHLMGPFVLSNVFIGLLGSAGGGELEVALGGSCEKLDDDHVRCVYPFAYGGNAVLPPLALAAVTGSESGLALSGTAGAFPTIPRGIKSIQQEPFAWEYSDTCHSQHQDAKARITVTCEPSVAPLLAHAVVRHDPHQVFTVAPHVVGRTVSIDVGYVEKVVYAQQPYECEVVILTSEGARIARLAPVPEKEQNPLEWSVLKARHCFRAIHQLWGHVYNPLWDVDPSPTDLPSRQMWLMDLGGLPRDKVVAVRDGAERLIGSARAGSLAMAQLGAIVDGEGARSGVRISLEDLAGDWHGSAPRHATIGSGAITPSPRTLDAAPPVMHERQINLRQYALSRVSQIPLASPAVGVALSQVDGTNMMFVATDDRVSVYHLGAPSLPRLIDEWRLDGVRGVRVIDREVWTWGRSGIAILAIGSPPRDVGAFKDVVKLAPYQRTRYLLLRDRIVACSERLEPLDSTALARGVDLAPLVGGIVAADEDGVAFFRTREGRMGREAHRIKVSGVSAVLPLATSVGQRSIFVGMRDGGGTVFDATALERPIETARYVTHPWFAGFERRGELVVRCSTEQHGVDIYVESGRAMQRIGWTGGPPEEEKG